MQRLLIADHKRARMVASKQCLGMFQHNSKKFLRRYVTVDETWVHHYTPETKNQSKMWTGPGESAPKKAKTVLSSGTIMAIIFWDSHGIILIDHLQKRKTITGEYYALLLDQLLIAATNEYFQGYDKNDFLEDIKKLEYRYNKCI